MASAATFRTEGDNLPVSSRTFGSKKGPSAVTGSRLGFGAATPRDSGARIFAGLAVVAVIVNLAFVLQSGGARYVGDSENFVLAGEDLLHGRGLGHVHASYAGFVLVLAAFRGIGLSLDVLPFLHIAVVVAAGAALYHVGRLAARPHAGLFAAAVVMIDPDIARWNRNIVTNPLYMSLLVLTVWSALLADRHRTFKWYMGAAVLSLATASIRPTGWMVPFLVAGFLFSRRIRRPMLRFGVSVALACAFVPTVALWSVPRSRLAAASPVHRMENGTVIPGYDQWRLTMPSAGGHSDGIGGAAAYAFDHPVDVAKLAAARVVAEHVSVRPFYGRWHNAYLLLRFLLLFPLAIVGWRSLRGDPMRPLLTAVIVGNALFVALTFASWDGRFLLFVLPLIALLTGCGMERVWHRRLLRSST
jgi:hypothetical protein